MTGTRKYPTADQAFGTVPTGSGHGGLPNVVFGLTGSGERDPGLFAGSCRARFAEPVSPGDPVGFSDGRRSTVSVRAADDVQALSTPRSRLRNPAISSQRSKR